MHHVGKGRHQTDAFATKGECPAAVCAIAIPDVERLQVRHVMSARLAMPFGTAVERPVVEHGELHVRCRMYVQFHRVRAQLERRPHGVDRIFDLRRDRLADSVAVQLSLVSPTRSKS